MQNKSILFLTVACLAIVILPWTAGGQNKSALSLKVACLTINVPSALLPPS